MASLAATQSDPLPRRRDFVVAFPSIHPRMDAEDAVPYERSVYEPSRRAGPVAFVATCGIMVCVAAALATLSVVAERQRHEHLTVVAMRELDTTPPPPPPEKLVRAVPPPPVFVPTPMVQVPSEGPKLVALDVPPPAAPPALVSPIKVAPTALAAAVPSSSAIPLDGGDLSSKVLSAKPPTYPIESRRRHEVGTVKLLVLVGIDGTVQDISIAGSSGSERLDRAALQAVRRWRWQPTLKGGAEVAVRGYVTIPFNLI